MAFRKILSKIGTNGLASVKGWDSDGAYQTYFLAQWMPDSLLLRTSQGTGVLAMLEDLKRGENIIARRNEDYWMYDANGFIGHWRDNIEKITDINIESSVAFSHRLDGLSEVMNMGLLYAKIGTVRWDGDQFRCDGYQPELQLNIALKGSIIGKDGKAAEMRVNYLSKRGTYDYALRYRYATNVGLAFFPSTIESYFISNNDGEIPLMKWDIGSILPAKQPLHAAALDLEKIIATNQSKVFEYTNGTWNSRNMFGDWVPVREVVQNRTTRTAKLKSNNAYYLAVAFLTCAAFGIAWRANRNKTQ